MPSPDSGTRHHQRAPAPDTSSGHQHPTAAPDTTSGHQHLTPAAGTTTGHHHPFTMLRHIPHAGACLSVLPSFITCAISAHLPKVRSFPCLSSTFRRCAVFRVFRPPSEGGRSSIAWVDLLHYRSAVRYRGSRRRAPSPPSSLTAAHRARVQNAIPENVYIFLSA